MRKKDERGSKDEGSPPSSEPDEGPSAAVQFRLPWFIFRVNVD